LENTISVFYRLNGSVKMANKPKVWRTKWNEDGTAYIMARILVKDDDNDLVAVEPLDVSSVVRRVFLVSNETVTVGPTTLAASDVFLDELSTGNIWTTDSTGFNFIDTVPAAAFPNGDTEYRVEYKITLNSGEVYWLLVEGTSLNVLTS